MIVASCMGNKCHAMPCNRFLWFYPVLVPLCFCQVAFVDMQAKETAGQAYDYTQVCAFMSRSPWKVSLGHFLRKNRVSKVAWVGMLAGLHPKSSKRCCSRAAAAALPWFICMRFSSSNRPSLDFAQAKAGQAYDSAAQGAKQAQDYTQVGADMLLDIY